LNSIAFVFSAVTVSLCHTFSFLANFLTNGEAEEAGPRRWEQGCARSHAPFRQGVGRRRPRRRFGQDRRRSSRACQDSLSGPSNVLTFMNCTIFVRFRFSVFHLRESNVLIISTTAC